MGLQRKTESIIAAHRSSGTLIYTKAKTLGYAQEQFVILSTMATFQGAKNLGMGREILRFAQDDNGAQLRMTSLPGWGEASGVVESGSPSPNVWGFVFRHLGRAGVG